MKPLKPIRPEPQAAALFDRFAADKMPDTGCWLTQAGLPFDTDAAFAPFDCVRADTLSKAGKRLDDELWEGVQREALNEVPAVLGAQANRLGPAAAAFFHARRPQWEAAAKRCKLKTQDICDALYAIVIGCILGIRGRRTHEKRGGRFPPSRPARRSQHRTPALRLGIGQTLCLLRPSEKPKPKAANR